VAGWRDGKINLEILLAAEQKFFQENDVDEEIKGILERVVRHLYGFGEIALEHVAGGDDLEE
jgi:hypothetical protein